MELIGWDLPAFAAPGPGEPLVWVPWSAVQELLLENGYSPLEIDEEARAFTRARLMMTLTAAEGELSVVTVGRRVVTGSVIEVPAGGPPGTFISEFLARGQWTPVLAHPRPMVLELPDGRWVRPSDPLALGTLAATLGIAGTELAESERELIAGGMLVAWPSEREGAKPIGFAVTVEELAALGLRREDVIRVPEGCDVHQFVAQLSRRGGTA